MWLGVSAQPEIPDEELVRRFQASSDINAYAELFVRHRRRIYCACRGFFGSGGAAEDATQETFLRAFEKIHSFVGGNFGGWLMRIARNVCIDVYRKLRPEVAAEEAGMDGIAAEGSLERDSDLHMAAELLREEMSLLPKDQCRCLEMKIEGYSYEETAARTGMTVEAVKSHLQNGRRVLWARMERTLTGVRRRDGTGL